MVELQVIKRTPRFAGLSEAASHWLSQRISRKTHPKKSTLFLEGEPVSRLFLIEYGSVKIYKTLDSGRELILNVFHSGEAVGEVALIDGDLLPASATIMEDSSILELSRKDYIDLGKLFPEALYATIRDLTQRVKAMTQRIHELGSGSVDARLAQLFLSLSKSGDSNTEGILLRYSFSRQELADMIGVRIETVIRTMSRWHKEEVVLTLDEGFLISKPAHLEDILKSSSR